jgi:hypothetical protein
MLTIFHADPKLDPVTLSDLVAEIEECSREYNRNHIENLECVSCKSRLGSRLRRPYLYCSKLCRQESKDVRYLRRVINDGRMTRADVYEAVQVRLGFTIAGCVYPEKERRLSSQARAAAIARDGGRCRLCGAPSKEVDHVGQPIDGDINHPDNLQVLCSACHRGKTLAGCQVVTPETHPKEWQRREDLIRRVIAPTPLRPSDGQDEWDWRRVAAKRDDSASGLSDPVR